MIENVPVKEKIKRNSYFYIYTFLLLMWSCRTSSFWDLYSLKGIMTYVYLGINFYFLKKYCKKVCSKPLLIVTTIHVIWYILSCVKYGMILHFPYTILYDVITIMIAYQMMKEKFLYYFDAVLSDLSLVCLLVWLGAVLFPSVVLPLVRAISITPVGGLPMDCNFFVFGLSGQFEMGIRRNLGFTWEPGRYACFLVLGLYINLTINKCKIGKNRNFWILFLSLLSTCSTTGYVCIFLIFVYYIMNRNLLVKVYVAGLFALFLPIVLAFSFMEDKIKDNMFNLDKSDIINAEYYMNEKNMDVLVPQRGLGAWIDVRNFIHDPLLGYASYEHSYGNTALYKGSNIVTSNGLIKIFAEHGFAYALFFYAMLFLSSVAFAKKYKVKGTLILGIVFATISFSYDFWGGFFLYFVLYSLFVKYDKEFMLERKVS